MGLKTLSFIICQQFKSNPPWQRKRNCVNIHEAHLEKRLILTGHVILFSSFVDFSSSNHHLMNFLTLNQHISYTSIGSSWSRGESQYKEIDFSKAHFPWMSSRDCCAWRQSEEQILHMLIFWQFGFISTTWTSAIVIYQDSCLEWSEYPLIQSPLSFGNTHASKIGLSHHTLELRLCL